MLLKRVGANRNSGWTELIKRSDVSVSWARHQQNIRLSIRCVSDVHLNGQYNYELDLNLEELVKILECLSELDLYEAGDNIAEKLAPATRSLLRLLIAAGGFPQLTQDSKSPRLRSTA
jgi:hypothetical protein